MNDNFKSGPPMFAMPYSFPVTQRPSVGRSLLFELISVFCLTYTLVLAFYLLTYAKDIPIIFFIYMFTTIVRITILIDLISRECEGKGKATGCLAWIAYFYLILDFLTVAVLVYLLFSSTYDELALVIVNIFVADFFIVCYLVITQAELCIKSDYVPEQYISIPFQPNY